MAKKKQPVEDQLRLERLFQMDPWRQNSREYEAKYELEFWWDSSEEHSAQTMSLVKSDRALHGLRSKFLDDSLYSSYRQFSLALSESLQDPLVFLSP